MRLVDFIVTSVLNIKKEMAYINDMEYSFALDQTQLYLRLWNMRVRYIISECMYASSCAMSASNVIVISHFLGLDGLNEAIIDAKIYV